MLLELALVFSTGYLTLRHFMAEVYCNTVTNSTLNRDQNPPLEEIRKAISWDPKNAEYWFKLSQSLREIWKSKIVNPDVELRDLQTRQKEIVNALEKAVRLNPFQAKYHLELAWEYICLGRDPADGEKWLRAADISMDRAAYFAGEKNPRLHVKIGNYWIMRSKTRGYAGPKWKSAWEKACLHYRKAQRLEKTNALRNEIKEFVWRFYPDRELIQEVMLPEKST